MIERVSPRISVKEKSSGSSSILPTSILEISRMLLIRDKQVVSAGADIIEVLHLLGIEIAKALLL